MALVETVVDVVEIAEEVVGLLQGEVVDIHPDDHAHVVVIVSATGKHLGPSLVIAFAGKILYCDCFLLQQSSKHLNFFIVGTHAVVHVPPATASMPIN